MCNFNLLFTCSFVSDSWQHRGWQHAGLLCPSLSPRVCSNSCPLSQRCHPAISFSVATFSSCPQFFPASQSFPMNWFFTSGGQSIGALGSASILPVNTQGWFPLGLTGWISLLSKGLLRVFSSTMVQSIKSWALSLLYGPTVTSVHDYWESKALTIQAFVAKAMSLLFNMLSRFVIAFLPKSKHFFISWLQSPSAVIF